MGDGKFPIKFPSVYKQNWIHKELRHEPTKSLEPKLPLLTLFTTPYYKVYRGKIKETLESGYNTTLLECPKCLTVLPMFFGRSLLSGHSKRCRNCPICGRRGVATHKNWPYAKRDNPTASERGEAKWQKDEEKTYVARRYGEKDMRSITDIALGGWKTRNKLQILIPRSLIGKTNYGVINNATIISDRYMLNPKVEWLEED
jgi:hypothetical protein